MSTLLTRRITRIAAIALCALPLATTSAAHAETGYRYWSFWLNDGTSWAMAQEGAGTVMPKDGDVEGWRYISAPASVGPEFAPRSTATFDDICGSTPAQDGKVRVALIVDFGDASDYNEAVSIPDISTSCQFIAEGDSAATLLSATRLVRAENGLVCAIDQLPTSGCGETVEIAANERAVTLSAPMADDATQQQPAEDDRIPQIVSIILGTVVFVMAWRRMQWQKQNKQK